MKGRFLSEELIEQFGKHLVLEEKSEHTVEKYLRDVRAFAAYAEQAEIGKETVIRYKQHLLESEYAVRSINSMLASLNSLIKNIPSRSEPWKAPVKDWLIEIEEKLNHKTKKKTVPQGTTK